MGPVTGMDSTKLDTDCTKVDSMKFDSDSTKLNTERLTLRTLTLTLQNSTRRKQMHIRQRVHINYDADRTTDTLHSDTTDDLTHDSNVSRGQILPEKSVLALKKVSGSGKGWLLASVAFLLHVVHFKWEGFTCLYQAL